MRAYRWSGQRLSGGEEHPPHSAQQPIPFEKRGENIINKKQLIAVGDKNEKLIAADRAQDAAYR
jgi:hypothetical protein